MSSTAIPYRYFSHASDSNGALSQTEPATSDPLELEIVSHCWNYSHLLIYQLSSLVNFPPENLAVTMTVFHSVEDTDTVALLQFFESIDTPNVKWNWQHLPKEHLFRRGIGRNQAALNTTADWIWFTDCDVIFHDQCLDSLPALLSGRGESLFFPRQERITPLLGSAHEMLNVTSSKEVLDIDTTHFDVHYPDRATGPLQITRGAVARKLGYCNDLKCYLEPADHWCKAREDRIFRWILETEGTPLDIPSVYRIRHAVKGRYTQDTLHSRVRTKIRQLQK